MLPIDFEQRIGELTLQFQALDQSIKKSPYASLEIYQKIDELALLIFQMKASFDQEKGTLEQKAMYQIESDIDELSRKVETLKKRLPGTFQATSSSSAVEKIIKAISDALKDILQKSLSGFVFKQATQSREERELPEKLKKAESELEKLEANMQFSEALILKATEVQTLKAKMAEFAELRKKGDEMRRQCQVLGGERITLTSTEGDRLDAMYLDAKKFRERLHGAGCQMAVVESEKGRFQGIYLSKGDFDAHGKRVIDALESLNGFEAGWSLIRVGEDYLIVRSEDLDKKDKVVIKEMRPIDIASPATSTIIVSVGSNGLYEKHKQEALFYLFNNMNVVLFNPPGYGQSEGIPTEHSLISSMESAYQLAKGKSGHPDSKITFMALCLTGGQAAIVAARHPETNLFLNQSYSNFKQLIGDMAQRELETLVTENINQSLLQSALKTLVGTLARQFVSLAALDFDTASHLAQNRGKKAIFFTQEDDVTDSRHMARNLEAIAKAGMMESVTVISGPGKHGANILNIATSETDFDERYRAKQREYERIQKTDQKEELARIQAELFDLESLIIQAQKTSHTGRNQLLHFFSKANLSQPILQTQAEMKRQPFRHEMTK